MKRVLFAAFLCVSAPLTVRAAETAATDPYTHGSVEAGAAKAAVCTACHGPGGNSANPQWPKLAGQSSRFIVEQLKRFKSGERQNPLMQPQAASLSDEDMASVAAYFAAQPAAPGVGSQDAIAVAQPLYRAGDAARGLPACAACHGPVGAGVSPAAFPRIGGQHAEYVAARLKLYRDDGTKGGLPDGNYKTMATVASKLSDAEIAALASYVNGLQ
jgi:cytochrome c553